MKNLLITGSSGFVGSYFIEKYSSSYNWFPVSLRKTKIENIVFNDIDVVVHLGALVHQMKGAPEEQYFTINRDLTESFALEAKKKGVEHFIFMSTSKVYGESNDINSQWDEQTGCKPIDPYGKSKLEAENSLLKLVDSSFKVSIIRTPIVYGPGVKGNIKSLIKIAKKMPVLPLGGINNHRTMVYVLNLCQLIDTIIKSKKTGIFLAGDATISTSKLVGEICKNLPKKVKIIAIPIIFRSILERLKPSFHQRLFGSLVINNEYTNSILNYEPSFSFEEGIKETVNDFINNGK
ncbi:MAG: NAD-dependent epimerase/dehydratase family protein [bacterium]